ncbi:thioredoxin family protein [Bordetella sp. N]|uniref:thioredoxin family protein n=1 Tax=Bordetella sp. N TaxID=1746199 RepID=UPI00070BC217|nr:thioredoxin family protein [Bordetella sp. N]ALM86264.1 thioredoxin [Bordetella sp. N]
MSASALTVEPARAAIDALRTPTLLEFGTDWCPHCQAAQPLIAKALAAHPQVDHIKVEDGKGRPLGRSFTVKLWPTLIFLRDGREVARLVRPQSESAIREALAAL